MKNLKYITFAVPSYNSEDYLHNAINSLIILGDDVEVIIINDGSKDNTLKIANEYKTKYPNIVKVIDKENGGHGSGVNAGLKEATGLYFKVVDSDDWLDHENGFKLLNQIKEHHKEDKSPDLYVLDFIYEKVSNNTTFIRTYKQNFHSNKIFDWNNLKKPFKLSKTLMMHALYYKTSVLKESGLELPHHTFYVDNLYSYTPLLHVKTLYYMPMVLYHYFIGREDQSIQMHNIVKRYDQQIRVMRLVIDTISFNDINKLDKGLRQYFKHFLAAIMAMTQMFTTGEYSIERKEALKFLWSDLKKKDKKMYNYLRYRSYNNMINFLPFRLKGLISTLTYIFLTKRIKLG